MKLSPQDDYAPVLMPIIPIELGNPVCDVPTSKLYCLRHWALLEALRQTVSEATYPLT